MNGIRLEDDHFCFACGQHNSDGLRLKFEYPERGRCRAEFVPGRKYQGWRGILHGGIIATLLDEALAHAFGGPDRGAGDYAVTAEIVIKFKKPVRTGERVVLEGRVLSDDRKMIVCESVLKNKDGVVLASGAGKLLRPRRPNP